MALAQKQKIEAARLAAQIKRTENSRMVMSMRFLKRLEEDGQPNLTWDKRVRNLMEIFDNAAQFAQMGQAERIKLKKSKRKPRPRSFFKSNAKPAVEAGSIDLISIKDVKRVLSNFRLPP